MPIKSGTISAERSLIGSLKNLYRAIPKTRMGIRVYGQEKAELMRAAGAQRLASDGIRTVVNMIDRGVSAVVNRGKAAEARPYQDEDVFSSYPIFMYFSEKLAQEISKYLPPVVAPIILKDDKNGFTCYQLKYEEDPVKYDAARKLVEITLGEYGYVGWSTAIDRSYDKHSYYFIVENDAGDIIATSRMVIKDEQNRIAFENGTRPDGTQYHLKFSEEGVVIDINSFYNRKKNRMALFALFATMGKYAWLIRTQLAFCLCDKNNKYISTLYQKAGFRFSKRFDKPIYFPTFGEIKDGKFAPTQWSVLEMGPMTLFKHYLATFKFRFI